MKHQPLATHSYRWALERFERELLRCNSAEFGRIHVDCIALEPAIDEQKLPHDWTVILVDVLRCFEIEQRTVVRMFRRDTVDAGFVDAHSLHWVKRNQKSAMRSFRNCRTTVALVNLAIRSLVVFRNNFPMPLQSTALLKPDDVAWDILC